MNRIKRAVLTCSVVLACFVLFAAEIKKADNTEPLNEGVSWVGGVVPTAADVALWDSTVTGANASALTNGVTWDGIKVTNPGGPVTLSGSSVLTLDGGAATDINLSAATQDMTVETPVAILFGDGKNIVAAGRTLTLAGPVTFAASGTYEAQGTGTVVMKGPVTSSVNTTLEIEKGTAVLTGETGGMTFTGTGSRIYMGRNSGNGSLIVSNGVHSTGSVSDEAGANFIGVGAWGHLFIENGRLTLKYLREAINGGNGELVINGGTLDVWGGSETAVRSGYALMIGNNHTDTATTSTSGSGTFTINGGAALFTNGIVKIASESSGSTGAQTVTLNGGVLGLKRFYVGASIGVTKTVNLNDGLLQVTGSGELFDGPGGTNGTLTVNVGDGGATVDVLAGKSVTLVAPLLGVGKGGLTKLGKGRLSLKGANTYAGKTKVMDGVLCLQGAAVTAADEINVVSSAGLSLADGALSAYSPAALTLGHVSAASTLELELATSGTACDVLAVPAGATLGRVDFQPVDQGTLTRAKRPGDYVVLTYAGTSPDIGLFTVSDPASTCDYSFVLNAEAKTVTLHIAYNASAESEWIATGGGNWETAGNWSLMPANAAGTKVILGSAVAAPATVTASSAVTLGGMAIDSSFAYTLAGGGFTFNNGVADPYLSVARGSHTVSAALTLGGAMSVAPALGAKLALEGTVGGGGSLVVNGAGELLLTTANAYSGGTVLKEGSLLVAGDATLGSGPITTDGGGGIRFNYGVPVTITNDVVIAQTANFNCLSNDVALTGNIDWEGSSRALVKTGDYEMSVSGSGAETALSKFQVDNGVLRFVDGANFELLSTGDRDGLNMKAATGYARTVIIEEGAQLTVSGIDTDSAPSNTVILAGGSLTLLGGGGSLDAAALRENGAGIDRVIVDVGTLSCADGSWFGIGYRVGDAHLVVNGGTATLSRVSMGAREVSLADLTARGFIDVNGGLLEVRDVFNWMGSAAVGRTNTVTLGNGTPGSGVWRTCATKNSQFAYANTPIMIFNGGTLETTGLATYGTSSLADYLYGAKEVYVAEGGARIDTLGLDITLAQPLQSGAVSDGGLTKLGTGTLTLTGACNFTGPTAVSGGALTLPPTYASTGLVVSAGASASLVNGGIQTLALNAASLPTGAHIAFEALADGSACDRIDLPAGATLGDLTISVVRADTGVTVTRPGDYVLFTCAGTPPAVSGWTLLNPPSGRTAEFVVDGSSVVLRVAYAGDVAIWTTDGSGDWETAANWTTPPGDAAGAAVRLDDAITSPATVTLAGTSTLGTLAFNNTQPYTVGGAALTLANTNGLPAVVAVEKGSHVMASAVNASGDVTVQAADGASLAATGGITASGTFAVEGPGTLGVADASALSAADLLLSGQGLLAVSNSTVITLDIALGAGGGAFAPAAGQTVDLQGAVSGSGGLLQEGSGFLLVTNANGSFDGAAVANAGTLRLDALPAGGIGFGQGTVHYIGAGATVAGGYLLDTGNDARAGVLRADGDITFQGNVSALSGALVKTGPGTVTFTAPGENVFNIGNGAGASHNVLDIGEYGDSPTTGFSGFNVTEGKVVIGAAGQTNVFNGLLVVGLNTTTNDDGETAGELDVIGGATTVSDTLIVGRSNGNTNTAPIARASKLKMTGGELTAGSLILGRALDAVGHNAAPELELTGGLLTVTDSCFIPEQAGAVATVTISGGKLDYLAVSGNSLRCCEFGGEAAITLSGDGELASAKMLILSYAPGSFSTLNLDGGTLTVQNLSKGSGTSGGVTFNGGVFRPTGEDQTLQGLTSAKVGAGGARIDLSQADRYTLAQKLTTDGADGGLTKTGAGTLVITGAQAYDGPTVVSEGTLQLDGAGSLSNVTALTASPGATLLLDPDATQTVALGGLTLGAAASAPVNLTLTFTADGTSHDRLAANGPADIGTVAVTLQRLVSGDAFGLSGTYTLFTYTGADPSVTEMSVANPLYGKTYMFAASSGEVTLTIAADYSGSSYVWSAAGGGAWGSAGNWALTPGTGAAGLPVRFDDAIATPASVTVSSAVTLGSLRFNNANAYTLSGTTDMSLDNGVGTQAVVSVEFGTHTLALPVALSDDGLAVDVANASGLTLAGALSGSGDLAKTGPGDLTVESQVSSRSGATDLRGGALVLKDGGMPGTGAIVVNGGTGLRVSGTAVTLANALTLQSNAEMDARDDDLTLTGMFDLQATASTLTKVGTNLLILAGTGSCATSAPALNVREGGVTLVSGAGYSFDGATRESVRLGAGSGVKTALTIEDGASLTAGGLSAKADATTTPGCDTLIVQNGGEVNLTYSDALFVRHEGAAPATYVMNGGTLAMPSTSWANVGLYGPGVIEVNGGVMRVGRFAAGYENRGSAGGYGKAYVTVNGGRLEAIGSWSWMSDANARLTDVTLNGGILALPATLAYATNSASWSGLTLNGGTLATTGAALDSSALDNYLGGVRRVAVDEMGGTVNTLGNDVTIRQNVLGLTRTGGVTKAGAGSLTLSGTNVVWGLVDVQEGTLRACLTHRGLPGTPLIWLAMDDSTDNADVSGNGFSVSTLGSGFTSTNRTATSPALMLSGVGGFSIPYNTVFTNVAEFTASAWIYVTYNATDSNQSIISARTGSSKALELKLNSGNNALRLLENSFNDQTWWQDIRTANPVPINQWVHVAAVVTPDGCAMYLNGVRQALKQAVGGGGSTLQDYAGGWPYNGDIRLMPAGSGSGIITVGRTTTTIGTSFKGALDEVMVFERALSDAEVAQLASEAPVPPASVRAASAGVLDLMGVPAVVSDASGTGEILGGLTVLGRLSPGDSEGEGAGAVLTVDALTLASNMTCVCTCDGVVSDLTDVIGQLTVEGPGVIDFGHTEANPFTGSFSVTVMTYGTVSGAANFADWTVTGLGRSGFDATVAAAGGEVVVTLQATWGTLMILK